MSEPAAFDAEDDRQQRTFHTTRWSVVLAAGRRSSPEAGEALESLCATYWYPLYAYVRRRVPDVQQAQDLTQAFFAELLDKNHVATADPQRGRFRAFLLTAFKHFLSKQWDKAKAQKRGGGRVPLSLDFATADSTLSIDPQAGLTAEQLYDQQWAITLLERTMQRLEMEHRDSGKERQFSELKPYLTGDHAGTTYRQAAESLDLTEAAARQAGRRLRRRYRQLLREEIAQTVSAADDVDDEIRRLFATFA